MKTMLPVVALLTLVLSNVAMAQVDRATLNGHQYRHRRGDCPRATVTITNVATNVAARQQTTATGSFLFVNLIPGRYQIDVELTRVQEELRRSSRSKSASARVSTRPSRSALSARRSPSRRPRRCSTQRRDARRGHPADAGREPAAGDPQLGRPARARARRAG